MIVAGRRPGGGSWLTELPGDARDTAAIMAKGTTFEQRIEKLKDAGFASRGKGRTREERRDSASVCLSSSPSEQSH